MKNKFRQKRLLTMLALTLALPTLSACDVSNDFVVTDTHQDSAYETVEDDSQTAEAFPDTVEVFTGTTESESSPDLYFGPMLEHMDFTGLLTSTEGQDRIESWYEKFLNNVKNNPNAPIFNQETVNYFRFLTSASGEKRHNVMFVVKRFEDGKEITNRWSYLLISTKDDFAVVAWDNQEQADYIVGFKDGEFVDEIGYLTQTDRDLINKSLEAGGYDATLNQVRDEFIGQLLLLQTAQDDRYILSHTGHIENLIHEDGYYNTVEKRDYIIESFQVQDAFVHHKVYSIINAVYDIPDDYLGTVLGD